MIIMKKSCSYLLMMWLILSFTISSAQTPTITATGVYNCTGLGTSQLTLPSGYAVYEWYNSSNVLVASTQTYTAATGTYTAKVKQTAVGSYIVVSAFTVTQIVPTAPTITPPSDVLTAICGVSSRNIVASGATNYDWKRDGVSTTITTATLSVTGSSVTTPGTYAYTVSTTNSVTGCTSTSTAVSLKVSPKPTTPVITPLTPNLICGTDSKTLTATTGGASYTWKRDATILSASTNTLTVTGTDVPTGTYNYKVVLQNAVGCVSDTSVSVSLKVSPKPATPVITPVTPNLICGTDAKTLTATSGGTSYLWKRNNTILSSTINTQVVTGTDVSVAGTYNYKVVLTNAVGCTSDTSVAVALKVSPKPSRPVISVPDTNAVCGVSTKTLTATADGSTYTWKRDATILSSTINTLTVTGNDVSVAGTYNYKVVLQNSVGCISDTSLAVGVKVSPKPTKPSIAAVDTNAICGVGTKTLTATSGGTSYVWKRDITELSSSKINTLLITGNDVTTAGTYSYTVALINSVGCISDASTGVSLKVSPKPAKPTITPDTSITLVCGTDSRILKATSGGTSYSWIVGSKTLTGSTSSAITVTGRDTSSANGSSNYTYTVALKNSVGCVSDYSTGYTLQLFPSIPAKPTITAGGVTTFCEGGNVTLTSSYTTNSNVWSSTTAIDTTTSKAVGLVVTKTGIYTVKAKDANGCVSLASDAKLVTVNPNPTAPTILEGTAVSICELESKTLTANDKGTGVYTWNTGSKTKSIIVSTAGSYSLTFTDANTCTSKPSVATVLTVNPLPVKPTISIIRPAEFCDGDSTVLRSSTASGYIWSTNQTVGQIIVKESKTISVIAVSDKGCKSKDASDPVTVIANPLPATPTVVANGPLIFCPDSTVTLSSSVIGNEYTWTNISSSIVFGKTQSVIVGEAGEYAVQAISVKKCISKISKSVKVSVREAPQPASILASPIATFCKGGTATLRALIANGNVDRYSWRDEDTKKEIATTAAITTDTSGRYAVKVRDTFGCFSAYSKVLKVTVNPLPAKPTLRIVRPKIFCDGDSTLLEASLPTTTTNGLKNVYQWTVDGLLQTGISGRTFTWKKANGIGVAVIDTNGCKSVASSDTIKTTVNPLPAAPSITLRGANPFCADKSVSLTAIGVQASSYKWSISNSTASTITVNYAGDVTVQAVSAFSCYSKSSQPITLSVYPLPATPQISATGNLTFCDGGSTVLATANINKAYWYKSTNDSLGNGTNNTIVVNKSGNYFARVEDKNFCLSAPSNAITVDVRSLPTTPVISQAGAFFLVAQSSGDENGYIWKYNGEEQKSFITNTIKVKKDGNYQVQASKIYNQVALPSGSLMCYSQPSLVYKYTQDLTFEGMNVYPNPSATGDITIQVVEDLIGADVSVYTMDGRLIETFNVNKFDTPRTIKLNGSIGNIYFIKLKTDSFERIKKVVVTQ